MANIQTFTNSKDFVNKSVELVNQTRDHAEKNFRMALSGGSSAGIINALQQKKFLFFQTEIWQVDERFVSPDHSDSNANLLKGYLEGSDWDERFFPILDTPEASIKAYQEMFEPDLEGYLFDLVVLGIGPDGHTASLFPGAEILDNDSDLVAVTQTDKFAVKTRLTLTFEALKRTRKIIVLMMGSTKSEIFKTITDPATDYHQFPARKLLAWDNVEILFLNN